MAAQSKRKSTGAVAFVAILVVLAPILYFLSIGPALVMLEQGTISKQQISTFYLPLLGLGSIVPPFRSILVWYGNLWVDTGQVA
jgi:hypothetical protein